MPTGLLPNASNTVAPVEPREVVEAMLAALAASDVQAAGSLFAEDIEYCNVGLPTLRGRTRAIRALALMDRPWITFEAYLHAITADGPVVLTERTDVITFGPVRLQFWVAGRFDVHDGQITLWRDAFDYLDMTRATWRGLIGAVLPALRPKAPGRPDVAPGRH
jgi:limonene-1,2-epoxide hydrolase